MSSLPSRRRVRRHGPPGHATALALLATLGALALDAPRASAVGAARAARLCRRGQLLEVRNPLPRPIQLRIVMSDGQVYVSQELLQPSDTARLYFQGGATVRAVGAPLDADPRGYANGTALAAMRAGRPPANGARDPSTPRQVELDFRATCVNG